MNDLFNAAPAPPDAHGKSLFPRLLRFLAVSLLVFLAHPLAASPPGPVTLEDGTGKYDIGRRLAWLADEENRLTIDDVRTAPLTEKFVPSESEAPNFGYTDASYWIKFDLIHVSERSGVEKVWLLELGYPPIDRVTLHQPDERGAMRRREAGDLFPFDHREIRNRHFIFHVKTRSNVKQTLYLNAKTEGVMEFPLVIWSQEAFAEKVNDEQFGFGFYYGLMAVMIIYNFLLFLSIRETTFLYYVLFILGYTIFQASLGGQGFEYLWPGSPWWANRAIPFFISFAGFWMAQFSRAFLRTGARAPRLDALLRVLMAGQVGMIVISLAAPYSFAIKTVVFCTASLVAAVVIAVVHRLRQGSLAARYFLVAWGAFITGVMAIALKSFGLLPVSFFTEYAIQIGSAMGVILLSLALGDIINTERKEKIVARDKALKAQREAMESLKRADGLKSEFLAKTEKKVEERTRDLNATLAEVKAANRKIMQSIEYARIIQRSMLPNLDEVKAYLPESFFIWTPRDVVGGDFFFLDPFEKGVVAAVVDCTGHGVPGAFMTMIAFSGLQRIIRDEGCRDPGEILKRLNFTVKTVLQQDTAHARSDDGLDAAVCCANTEEKTIIYAGARIPLFYGRGGEIHVLKGDKQSVGYKRSDLNFLFTNRTLPIEKGMSFYMATDGFTGQRGGEKGLSLGKRRLVTLLGEIRGRPFHLQREMLIEAFNDYKGEYERQDDVTVVGFGFPEKELNTAGIEQ
ncbi:MAG: SpoIIE family protein phosphatase [Desulfobacterales bacterium]|nr:SpoIIE family protein phosphatase [Desulfobacterales bacterium]